MKINEYAQYVKDKNILIFGLGLLGGGVGATKFFARYTKNIRITDLKNEIQLKPSVNWVKDLGVKFVLGEHRNEDIEWADIIVVNQDVWNKAPNSPYIAYAQSLGKQLETETGLFFELCQCPIIGITGSRGKTTTTIATAELLKAAGKKIIIAGNVPESETLNMVEQTVNADYAVLELSNFQLHGLHFKKKSPHIAVITSISPDHLISYVSMADYVHDKKAIYEYQNPDDFLIVKTDDVWGDEFAAEAKSSVRRFSQLPADWNISIPGNHNRQNLGAVYELGKILGIDEALSKAVLCSFKGVVYRLENIGDIHGVTFINDTTATTPTAACIALASFPAEKIIWIAGGNTKNLPQQELIAVAKEQVKHIAVLQGTAAHSLENDLEGSMPQRWDKVFLGEFNNLRDAFYKAYEAASPDDIILLSPGFTSFGMFENEFERGKQFNALFKELKANSNSRQV